MARYRDERTFRPSKETWMLEQKRKAKAVRRLGRNWTKTIKEAS